MAHNKCVQVFIIINIQEIQTKTNFKLFFLTTTILHFPPDQKHDSALYSQEEANIMLPVGKTHI